MSSTWAKISESDQRERNEATGSVPDFRTYDTDVELFTTLGDVRSVLDGALIKSFGKRNDTVPHYTFKFRGLGLDAVERVLREFITGSGGDNRVLKEWVDDLTASAAHAIEADGGTDIDESRAKMAVDDDSEQGTYFVADMAYGGSAKISHPVSRDLLSDSGPPAPVETEQRRKKSKGASINAEMELDGNVEDVDF
ncbi:hypothetical protein B0H13DRAFT_2337401 [Mycena leptocephala]|nr:hypothetical protein B0H13DRAFT_2337401 [Mycena leptocephala]